MYVIIIGGIIDDPCKRKGGRLFHFVVELLIVIENNKRSYFEKDNWMDLFSKVIFKRKIGVQ